MDGDKPEVDPARYPKTTEILKEFDMPFANPEDVSLVEPKPPLSRRDFRDPFEDRGLTPGQHEGTDWPWEDPHPDSPEYMAQHYTQEYLRGVDKPYRGFARDPQNDHITKATMDRLVAVEPENYFAWGLRRRQELKAWMVPAAEALIDRDPYTALMKGIYNQGEEIKHLLPKLWSDVLNAELNRAAETETGKFFPGMMFNRMKSLAGEIARTNPQFYIDEIAEKGIGRKFRTTQFDNWASNALRDK